MFADKPLLAIEWLVVGGWLLLATLGIAALIALRSRLPQSIRAVVAVGSLVAGLLGYLTSWASLDSWLAGTVVIVVLLVAARWAFAGVASRGALLGAAAVVGYVGAVGLAQQFTFETRTSMDLTNPSRFLGLLAIALVLLAAVLPSRWVSSLDRRVLFWLGLPVAVFTTTALGAFGTPASLLLEPLTSVLAALALVLSLAGFILLRRDLATERVVASLAVAPMLFFAVDAIGVLSASDMIRELAPSSAALVVAAAALVLALLRPTATPRLALDGGAAFVGALGVMGTSYLAHEYTWLALLVAGVATLLLSVSADGLFGSASPRRFLGWLALALVTGGLWSRLDEGSVTALEPYVLPLAGALLLVALLAWRVKHNSLAAPFIALVGLLVAILPLAVSGSTGELVRPIVVGAASAVLLLGGNWLTAAAPLRRYLDAAAAAGAVGVLAVAIGRAGNLLTATGTPDLRFDAWLGAALGLLLLAAFGQARNRADELPATRFAVGQALGTLGLGTVVLFEATSLDGGDLAQVRVLAVIVLCAVISVLSLTLDRGPLRPALGWVALGGAAVMSAASLLGTLEPVELGATLVIIAFLTSAIALVVTLLGSSPVSRVQREIGFATLAGLSLFLVSLGPVDTAWIVLEIAAVTALLLAISPDGLFAAASPRKHLGWVALALAVGGLWWRLAGSEIRDVEPYVLPLAGALLLVAGFVWRESRRAGVEPAARPAAPLIALGGLLVALVPIGLNAASGPVERAVIVGAASALLLLAGSFLQGRPAQRPYLDVASVAGALGVLVVTIGRAWFISGQPGVPDATLDAWLAVGLLVLLLGAVGQSLPREAEESPRRAHIAELLALVALSTGLLFELFGLADDTLARALGAVIVFAAVHVLAVTIDTAPFTRRVAWVALAFAAVTATSALMMNAFEQVEYASLPVALALLGGGAIHLARHAEARSWPHLGPGMLVLMVPSLLATLDDRPLWRAIGLAVVGITIIVIGLVRRLQAPFLVASIVTIVHVVATFSPQLRELYELNSWLVWIVVGTIGGTLLVVLAARFEKSLSTARTTLRRVADLR